MRQALFAETLSQLLRERGMSAFAASRKCGFSENYLRNLCRGVNLPSAKTVAKIAAGLELNEDEAHALHASAGLRSKRMTTAPDEETWRPLLFVAVNHFYLPRLDLRNLLSSSRRLSETDRALILAAASHGDIATFAAQASDTKLTRGIARIVEHVFGETPAADVRDLVDSVKHVIARRARLDRRPAAVRDPGDTPQLRHELWKFAYVLLPYNRPQFPTARLFDFVHDMLPDYGFTIAYFPPLFWHACHAWPFAKVKLAHPHRAAAQGAFYERIRAGLSLGDFSRELLDGGGLMRTSDDWDRLHAVDERWPITRVSPQFGENVQRAPGRADGVFDYWDRAAFIKRFPLVSLDRAGFLSLGRSLEHPYWKEWDDHRRSSTKHPERLPAVTERFAHVLGDPGRWYQPPDRANLPDQIDRLICSDAAEAVARLIHAAEWSKLLEVADQIGLEADTRAAVAAAANRAPTAR